MTKVRILLWLPLVAFILVLVVVLSGLLKPHDSTIASKVIGRPVLAFTLPSARFKERPRAFTAPGAGKPHLINLFASWCVPCLAESPQLLALKQSGVLIEGLAIRDANENIKAFLERNGDPYDDILRDDTGAVQVALGSSGVPETFVVDSKGIIRLQHIGEIRAEDVPALIEAVRQAQ